MFKGCDPDPLLSSKSTHDMVMSNYHPAIMSLQGMQWPGGLTVYKGHTITQWCIKILILPKDSETVNNLPTETATSVEDYFLGLARQTTGTSRP